MLSESETSLRFFAMLRMTTLQRILYYFSEKASGKTVVITNKI